MRYTHVLLWYGQKLVVMVRGGRGEAFVRQTDKLKAAAAGPFDDLWGVSGEWTIGPNEWTGERTNGTIWVRVVP